MIKMLKTTQKINLYINRIKYMLRFIRVMSKRYHKLLLAVLGLFIFTAYFWMRFLRTRTVKVLPLQLSIEGFFILVYIVFIFAYIIISLLFVKGSNTFIEKIIDIIFIPLKELDKGFKNIPFIKIFYEKVLIRLMPILEFLIKKTDLFFILFWLFPRSILLLVLSLDIFVFKKFEYRYKFLFIGLLLLFNRCFKYSLKNTKNQMYDDIQPFVQGIWTKYYRYVHPSELEPDFDPEDPEEGLLWGADADVDMVLPFDVFLEHRLEYLVYRGIDNPYSIISSNYASHYFQMKYLGYLLPKRHIDLSPEEYNNYRTPFGDFYASYRYIWAKENEYINPKVKLLVRIAELLEYYSKTSNNNGIYKGLKVMIYIGYLVCWSYVLIISYPKISTAEWNKVIMFLDNYKDILAELW